MKIMISFPNAFVENRSLKVWFALPHHRVGYYRATRFDWSGVIYQLLYDGCSFFSPWRVRHNPLRHDAISGPVNEFGVVGYEKAAIGDSFLKIGVGTLLKNSYQDYNAFSYYTISNPGFWRVKIDENVVSFIHRLKTRIGYSYTYTKRFTLHPDRPEMTVDHNLRNEGNTSINTYVYNHNFLRIDKEKTGPETVVNFPFNVEEASAGNCEHIAFRRNSLSFTRPLEKNECVYLPEVAGITGSSENHAFCLENKKVRACVHVSGNRPLIRLAFWACATTCCLEPYIQIAVEGGKCFSWRNSYKFSTY